MTQTHEVATDDAELVAAVRAKALLVRRETIRLISIAKTGHYASAFSCAEIFAALYYGGVMRLQRGEPDWPARDRLLLGKGHAAVGLYPLLADWGFFDAELLDGYTRLGNPLGDHPDMRRVPGVDFSSGSLGHALSAGLGMTLGGRITDTAFDVFVVLGDGELHEGQVWEAANAAGHYGVGNLVAIVDRNRFSLDGEADEVMAIEPLADRWRAFGWEVCEVDGHDVPALLRTLHRIRAAAPRSAPTVVIAHTVKGRGISYMESDRGWHLGWLNEDDERAAYAELDARYGPAGGGPVSFGRTLHPDSWELTKSTANSPTLGVLADTLADLADEGHPIAVATADLKYSNGLSRFQDRHPERFVQFGISEQNMVTACAGMATTGLTPYVATFASFLAMLCCEQIHTDVAYPRLPVRLIGHHAGIALGFYGTSHHAHGDLATMRCIPDLAVVGPADGAQLESALRNTVDYPGPIYFRIGRGRDPEVYPRGTEFELGRAIVHELGSDLTIIAIGSCVHPALDAAARLRGEGMSVGVIDMHTVKPLDRATILAAAGASRRLMTVEEHNVIGGLGGAVSEVLSEAGQPTPLHRHGLRDVFSLIGPPTHLYRHYRLDGDGIAAEANDFVNGTLDSTSQGVGATGYLPPEIDRR